MTTPPEELIRHLGSDDFNERARALAALVARGRSAAPSLAQALGEPGDLVRAQAAQALAEIADPDSADLSLRRGDARRERGCPRFFGLARIGDPRAVDALVRTCPTWSTTPARSPCTA